jgi:hypothetical protein
MVSKIAANSANATNAGPEGFLQMGTRARLIALFAQALIY